jgi:hypothetical protein
MAADFNAAYFAGKINCSRAQIFLARFTGDFPQNFPSRA